MSKILEKLTAEIQSLPDIDKMHLVDVILADLDKPDPEIDRVWANESRNRWDLYKAGRIPTVSYQEVMDKHRRT